MCYGKVLCARPKGIVLLKDSSVVTCIAHHRNEPEGCHILHLLIAHYHPVKMFFIARC
jgi:hypothetical protein